MRNVFEWWTDVFSGTEGTITQWASDESQIIHYHTSSKEHSIYDAV
jgi:hypothetical protein